jgi:hypothetical protein
VRQVFRRHPDLQICPQAVPQNPVAATAGQNPIHGSNPGLWQELSQLTVLGNVLYVIGGGVVVVVGGGGGGGVGGGGSRGENSSSPLVGQVNRGAGSHSSVDDDDTLKRKQGAQGADLVM